MFIIDSYVIMHFPRTAGTSIRNKLIGDQRVIYSVNHASVDVLELPEFQFAKDFKKIALIREPLSWYVSWWNFHIGIKPCPLTAGLIFDNNYKLRPFEEAITRMIHFQDSLDETFYKNHRISYNRFPYGDMTKVFPEIPKQKTLWHAMESRFIDESMEVFRFDDQLQDFLNLLNIDNLRKYNSSPHNKKIKDLPDSLIQEILDKHKDSYNDYSFRLPV